MFRISKAEEQALRLTMRLAAVGEQQTLGELAEAESLSEPTVAKLLGQLKRGGVVATLRGRRGGYILADAPETITADKILEAVASKAVFGFPCRNNENGDFCVWTGECGLRPVWALLEHRVMEVLRRTTVLDMLRNEKDSARKLAEVWPLPGE